MANFDKQVKKQAESFSLEPRKEVWKSLEAELDKTKKRRFAQWIWVLPIVLLAGTTIFYYSTTRKARTPISQTQTIAVNTQPQPKEKPGAEQPLQNTRTATDKNTRQPVNTKNKSFIDDKKNVTNQQQKSELKSAGNTNIGLVIINKKEVTETANTEIEKQRSADFNKTSSTTGNTTAEAIVGSPVKVTDNNTISEKSSVTAKKHQEIANVKTTTDTENKQAEQKALIIDKPKSETVKVVNKNSPVTDNTKLENQRRIKWHFVMGAGVSNNAEAYDFLKQKQTSGDSNLANSVPPGLFAPMEKSKPGLSLSLAVKRTQWINKRWQWQASAGAQLQQDHQYTGARYDDPIVPSPDNFYSADYFFESGKTINHTGNNYRIFLTNNIAWLPFKKLPGLLVNIGVSAGVNVYDRYLLGDSNFVLYIRSDEYYRRFYGALNIGTSYTLKKGITLGVTANHDFNKSFRPLDTNNHYWRSLLFSVGIPLSDKNKGR